jgi:asparaginyl-tRNA synthetase
MRIQDLLNIDEELLKKGTFIVQGWVRQYRGQSDIVFMNINDGTNAEGLQVVCSLEENEKCFHKCKQTINSGCYLKIKGKIIDSPSSGQQYEMKLVDIIENNECDIKSYPINKSIKIQNLRQLVHYRAKTKVFGCIFRIRNTLMYGTHNFYQMKNMLHLDPNIITINECEGGAGVFTATELMDKQIKNIPTEKNGQINYKKDHFKRQTYLTVSSQLQLEALACGMGDCYTTNKSFRSEHSMTNKHVSEFTHLEIEMIDIENKDLMNIGKEYIQYIIKKVYENNYDDLKELNKFSCKGILDRFEELLKLKFEFKSYDECIELIKKETTIDVNYGDDLSTEMEHFLTDYFKGAVFVYDWPFAIKSFYMKIKDNDNTKQNIKLCENFDLLMPYGIGELIGGSMREHRYDFLRENMKEKNVSDNGLEWYIDLRKYGSVKHGGFGLGMDRFLMLLTGMTNIKDVIPFPVSYQNCNY